MQSQRIVIKIGHQNQADKDIFLYHNGTLQCGNLSYRGRYVKKFQKYYDKILELTDSKPKNGVVDVSQAQYWDATSIYYEYVVAKWVARVSAKILEKFANETSIRIMLKDIEPEFKRSCRLAWRKIFKAAGPNNSSTPKHPWQIL